MKDRKSVKNIPMPARSVDVNKLREGTIAAGKISDEGKRDEAMSKAVSDATSDKAIQGSSATVPPGHEMKEIKNAQGDKVTAPVFVPEKEEAKGDKADAGKPDSSQKDEKTK